MKSNELKMTLPSVDDLFEDVAGKDMLNIEKAIPIPISKLFDFPSHPFKVNNDEAIIKMVDRLAEAGINTEKAILNMDLEDLEKLPNYTITDIKTLISLRKAIKANKKALFLFLGDEVK